MGKPTLCLDFDGVLHSYESGWVEIDFIPDPPVKGAMDFLHSIVTSGRFNVCIFSSRSETQDGRRAMQIWLTYWAKKQLHPEWANAVINAICNNGDAWPTKKPPAFVTLDDRALTFDGTWPSVGTLLNFKPWNRKD